MPADTTSEAGGALPEAAVAETTPPQERCQNCSATVTGRFCASCGQRIEHSTHSVWHFLREATEDLTHADSRLWRTIAALLFKPGFLTREFLDGRRARYLPPIRLYLVLSVLFFFLAGGSLIDHPPPTSDASAAQGSALRGNVTAGGMSGRCDWVNYRGPASTWLDPILRANCQKVAEDRGRSLFEQFDHTLPRALFLFLPFIALIMKPLYRHPPRYYVEHLLFFLHDHAAAFLLLSIAYLIRAIHAPKALADLVGLIVGIYLPVYLYQSMRRMYGQSGPLTGVKFLVLAVAYLLFGSLLFALVVLYSYLTV